MCPHQPRLPPPGPPPPWPSPPQVLMEQQRLQASMQSVDEQSARRMRSMVTHKKLKEIAVAQQVGSGGGGPQGRRWCWCGGWGSWGWWARGLCGGALSND